MTAEWEMLCTCPCFSTASCNTASYKLNILKNPFRDAAVHTSFSQKTFTAPCLWTTHPTPSGSLLSPSPLLLLLLPCQGFHPGQWDDCQPHASTLANTQHRKHIVAEEKVIHTLTDCLIFNSFFIGLALDILQ